MDSGGSSYSLKEMMTALLEKVDVIDKKLDDLKDSKADKDDVNDLKDRVHDLEIKEAKNEGVAAFKRWFIPIVVSAVVSLIATFMYINAMGVHK